MPFTFKLNLGLQNEEAIDPAVASELEQIIASLQAQFVSQLSQLSDIGDDLYNPPRMRVFLPGNQSIPDSTDTTLIWSRVRTGPNDVEEYDSHNYLDLSNNTVNIQKPGLWVLAAQIAWSGASLVGSRSLVFTQINGVVTMSRRWPGDHLYCLHTVPINITQVMINAGLAKFSVVTAQGSGGALDAGSSSWFAAYRVAPFAPTV